MKFILTLSAMALLCAACSKNDTTTPATGNTKGQTTLTFDARVGNEDFALNKEFTINDTKYSFSQLRYWVSNIALVNEQGTTWKVPSAYFLLEENAAISIQDGKYTYPARKRETVELRDVPAGTYRRVIFSIGVDATYNDNLSLQAGELSQLNGMTNISWMWHTSYLFSSLKGSILSGAAPVALSVETGLNTNYRTLQTDLPAPLVVNEQQSGSITFQVDVAKIIAGVDLMKTPRIGAAQPAEMKQVADNYGTKAIQLMPVNTK
ncbi:MbnP family protein [Chitinophaga nivalis]|uniref:Copper-binding protein MbnP-like domain-containing protein n=1 Tax=Chitinophaga nivalis TaxID=2991709 RepID=A0ABT3IJ62_9BACT|nr:MbnP family protein [Chitinophaga nivalis]MCW3466308.1 hypothetical protein [Chitinophaga nivalis]MCW3484001.1 hypothetical protein [Chitinophaga nivalis]